jgi:hypothetical protein
MAKHTAGEFTEEEQTRLAEMARGVYWRSSLVHAVLDVISQKYPHLGGAEQERLARRVAAIARAQLRRESSRHCDCAPYAHLLASRRLFARILADLRIQRSCFSVLSAHICK